MCLNVTVNVQILADSLAIHFVQKSRCHREGQVRMVAKQRLSNWGFPNATLLLLKHCRVTNCVLRKVTLTRDGNVAANTGAQTRYSRRGPVQGMITFLARKFSTATLALDLTFGWLMFNQNVSPQVNCSNVEPSKCSAFTNRQLRG